MVFEKAERCIVPTKELADWICKNYDIASAKIAVIPNYVDTEQFKPDTNVKKDFDIICIGRLEAKKRHKLLLEALQDMEIKIHIIGDGLLKDQISRLAKNKAPDIKMTQRVEHKELPRIMNGSKIYVNLSEWEGHPKALIEAMSCGCACVGAKSPGIENLIINGQTGIIVEAEPLQVRNAIKNLLTDSRLREQLGEKAREYAKEQFSLERVFEKYLNLFHEILSG